MLFRSVNGGGADRAFVREHVPQLKYANPSLKFRRELMDTGSPSVTVHVGAFFAPPKKKKKKERKKKKEKKRKERERENERDKKRKVRRRKVNE